jgi:hypothetical protein
MNTPNEELIQSKHVTKAATLRRLLCSKTIPDWFKKMKEFSTMYQDAARTSK